MTTATYTEKAFAALLAVAGAFTLLTLAAFAAGSIVAMPLMVISGIAFVAAPCLAVLFGA